MVIASAGPVETPAEQLAVAPPFVPAHVHVQGPEPETAEAVPAPHSPAAGALEVAVPFAAPQAPSTFPAASGAEQLAVAPPLLPVHVHVQGPEPETAEAVPAPHSPVAGALEVAVPFAAPQAPSTFPAASGAEQLAVAPPLLPAHVHVQGPEPETAEAVPAPHSPVAGALEVAVPFAAPQAPSTFPAASGAEQLAVAPTLLPVHVHVQGPEPVTAEAVPAPHSPVAGALEAAVPFAAPHAPSVGPVAVPELASPTHPAPATNRRPIAARSSRRAVRGFIQILLLEGPLKGDPCLCPIFGAQLPR